MVQEMHAQSFAYRVIVYGTAKKNQHKSGAWEKGRAPGTFFALYISQDRQARRKQAREREKLAEHVDNSITVADATTTLNSGQPRVRTPDRQQGPDCTS
jgi:hypothetical protein